MTSVELEDQSTISRFCMIMINAKATFVFMPPVYVGNLVSPDWPACHRSSQSILVIE